MSQATLAPNSLTSSTPTTRKFESGAIRCDDDNDVRYDLICTSGLRRLAATYAEGFGKYGADNWTKGIPISNILNHLEKHLVQFKQGDTSEDHLGHAAWGIFALIHFTSVCDCHECRAIYAVNDQDYLENQK